MSRSDILLWLVLSLVSCIAFTTYQLAKPLSVTTASLTAGDLPELQIDNKHTVEQPFVPTKEQVSKISVRYNPSKSHFTTVRAQLNDNTSKGFIDPSQPGLLFFDFETPISVNAQKTVIIKLSVETAEKRYLYLPYEQDTAPGKDHPLKYNNRLRPDNIALTAYAPASVSEKLNRIFLTNNELATVYLLVFAAAIITLTIQLLHQYKNNVITTYPPPLIFVSLAMLFAMPIFHNASLWGRWDWPEAVSHYAAARQSFSGGEFPLWTPLMCGGAPLWESPQAYWPSLTFLLTLIAGDVLGTKLAFLAYTLIGIYGMYNLARLINIKPNFALIPPTIFMFSGFMSSHLAAGQMLWLTSAYVPWVIYFFLKSFIKPINIIPSVVFYLFIFLEGRVYINAYLALALLIISLGAAAFFRRKRLPVIRLAQFVLLFCLLGAVKILPVLSFLSNLPPDAALPKENGIPIARILEVLLTRTAALNYQTRWLQLPWHEYAAYTGIIALTLTLFGYLSAWRKKNRMLLITGLVGLVFLALSTVSAANHVYRAIPLVSQLHNPGRAILIAVFAIALGAGYGAQQIAKRIKNLPVRIVFAYALLSLITVDLVTVAWPALAKTYSEHPIEFVNDSGLRQSGGHTDSGYHMILAGVGSKDYCPTYLRGYNNHAEVLTASDSKYAGEVYAMSSQDIVDRYSVTSNSVSVQMGQIVNSDKVVINQRYSPSWTISNRDIEEYQGKPSFSVSAIDSEKNIIINYRPFSFLAGAFISFLTVFFLFIFWLINRNTASKIERTDTAKPDCSPLDR